MSSTTPNADVARLRRPGWKDPRLVLGLLLVIGSIVGVVALVGALDRTVPVYTAKEDISLGDPVGLEDLEIADVRLNGVEERYLEAGAELPEGLRSSVFIGAGELVPARALEQGDPLGRKPVSVGIDGTVADAIVAGTHVDVWAASLDESGRLYDEPTRLLKGIEVAGRESVESAFGGTSGTQLELLVTDEQLPALLDALANEAKITVVYSPAGDSQ
ncbi:SAF domain-containing protein [Zhihengliuella sp.]|uniref:SAF domain-containing protein n=1 Tax=Zhihengliuella sp. TaxID=1954483 RepID=UPI002810B1A7|nr:SAF domain-containing protein [Zhihengliuella sp.]